MPDTTKEAAGHTLKDLAGRHDDAVKRSEALLVEHHNESDPIRAKELLEQSDRYLEEADRWARAHKSRKEMEEDTSRQERDIEDFTKPTRVPRGRNVGEGRYRVRAGHLLTDPMAIAEREELFGVELESQGEAQFSRADRVLMKANTPSEDAFYRYIRGQELSGDQKAMLAAREGPDSEGPVKMFDANGLETRVATTTTGAVLIPTRISNQMQMEMIRYGPFLRPGYTQEFRTPDLAGLTVPVDTDATRTGASSTHARVVGENTAVTPIDPNLRNVTLPVDNYASMIHVTERLFRASQFNIDSWLTQVFASRFARGLNQAASAFFTNAAAGTPAGLPAGRRTATSASNVVDYDDLSGVVESINDVYLDSCRWQVSQAGRLVLRQLKDGDERPIWAPYQIAPGIPETLLGFPLDINPTGFGGTADNALFTCFGSWRDGFATRIGSGFMMARSEHVGFANFNTALRMNAYYGWARLHDATFRLLTVTA